MRRIALTGGIGDGQDARAQPLPRPRRAGHRCGCDCTRGGAARLARSRAVSSSVSAPGVLTPEGTLDRARLGEIVFRDKDARRDLEAILHPLIRARHRRAFFASFRPDTALAVADVPLLYETGRQRHFDSVIVAACPRERADRARHGARRAVARGRGASCGGAAAHRFENGARRLCDPHRRVVRGNGSASGQVARAVTH